MISAILRAQLLSMRTLRSRGRGTAFLVLTGLIFYGFWTFIAFGVEQFFASSDRQNLFPTVLASGLMVAFLYWQLAPVLSVSFGASLDLKKLMVYPIAHEKLFFVEVALRFTACGELLIVLLGVYAGLLRNPDYGGARGFPRLTLALVLFLLLNLLLSAGTRGMVERLLMRSHIKEAVMFLLVLAGLLPQVLFAARMPRSAIERFIPTAVCWPWAATERLLLGEGYLAPLAILLAFIALAYGYGRSQFEKSLRYDPGRTAAVAEAARPSGRISWMEKLYRLPTWLLPDPLAAVTEKELRTLIRIPRVRLVVVMSCCFGLIFYVPLILKTGPPRYGPSAEYLPAFCCVYALLMLGQISYTNAFGFDRSAAQAWFSLPVNVRVVLKGKNIAVCFVFAAQLVLVNLVALLMRFPITPVQTLEGVAVSSITALYWLGVGNLMSVHLPRAMDPERMNQMSNKLQALAIWTLPLLLLPVALAYWARHVFENDGVFYALLALAAVMGGVFYWVALDSAAATATKRREQILRELSRGDGPLAMS